MNLTSQMNQVITYIEDHLEESIDYDELAEIVNSSPYHFQRIFTMIAGMPLGEYIRRRKMTKAAFELQNTDIKVIDLALKYGYQSPTAFNRAFQGVHNVAPTDARKGATLTAQIPLALEVVIKGTDEFNYRIEQREEFRIIGAKMQTTMEKGICYQEVPAFWGRAVETKLPESLLPYMDGEPKGVMGVSACGMILESAEFDYYIGVASSQDAPEGMEEYVVPACTWAVFTCETPDQVQGLEKKVVLEWLPTSGYEYGKAPDIELSTFNPATQQMYFEVWLPVISKL